MRPGRLELPPRLHRTRPSTLRVYQFRHRRVEAPSIEPGSGLPGRLLDVVRPPGYSANTCSDQATETALQGGLDGRAEPHQAAAGDLRLRQELWRGARLPADRA